MAGNTGKMTNNEIRARGPRMQLLQVYSDVAGTRQTLGFVIARGRPYYLENCSPFGKRFFLNSQRIGIQGLAQSYSLGYLRAVGKSMKGLV
jgi:hypothetical protein